MSKMMKNRDGVSIWHMTSQVATSKSGLRSTMTSVHLFSISNTVINLNSAICNSVVLILNQKQIAMCVGA